MAMSAADFGDMKIIARQASERAYCPYSKFRVGASLLIGSEILSGCNVENASYGLTICAERNVIFQAVARGTRQIRGVVIYTPTGKPTAPCGACRQVLNEFNPDMEVLCFCDGVEVIHTSLRDLLPNSFGPANL